MSYMGLGEITAEHFAENDDLMEHFIPAHKQIWLFGAGVIGKAFSLYLQDCGVKVAGFVVSAPDATHVEDGKPVVDIAEFRRRYETENGLALLLTVDTKYYDEIIPKLLFLGEHLRLLSHQIRQCAVGRCGDDGTFPLLTFHIVDHCNLSCYGCTAASPIAKNSLYDFDEFTKDLAHLRQLFGSKHVGEVNFTGGDVLQHPRFLDFIEYARQLFQDSKISVSTNGLLFHKQDEVFWKRLAASRIALTWTLYPVHYANYEQTVETIRRAGIALSIIGDKPDEDKNSWRIPFNEKGGQKPHDFLFCVFHRRCAVVRNGVYCPCCATRQLSHHESEFNTALPLRPGDTLVVREVKTLDELERWLRSRPPLCDFCALRDRKSMGQWLPSKKEKSEWFIGADD